MDPSACFKRRETRGSRITWIILLAASTISHTVAQSVTKSEAVTVACIDLNQTALTHVANGKFNEAELAVFAALASAEPFSAYRRSHQDLYDDRWDGDVLHYTGMDRLGDQSLIGQNPRLAQQAETKAVAHLFEVFEQSKYVYCRTGGPFRQSEHGGPT
jgi:hypothetical protein